MGKHLEQTHYIPKPPNMPHDAIRAVETALESLYSSLEQSLPHMSEADKKRISSAVTKINGLFI